MPTYNLRSLQLPRLTGAALKTYTAAVETRGVRSALIQNMLHSGGIDRLHDALIEDAPTGSPLVSPQAGAAAPPEAFAPCSSAPDFPLRAISDYARAYRDGALTPLDVAERFLAALDRSEQGPAPLRAYIACRAEDVLEQARDATRRFAEGRPLGMLDGVPLALKDEIDMLPYPTTVGTAFLGAAPADADSTVAARLRAAGALLTGKTNMHEIGINPMAPMPTGAARATRITTTAIPAAVPAVRRWRLPRGWWLPPLARMAAGRYASRLRCAVWLA